MRMTAPRTTYSATSIVAPSAKLAEEAAIGRDAVRSTGDKKLERGAVLNHDPGEPPAHDRFIHEGPQGRAAHPFERHRLRGQPASHVHEVLALELACDRVVADRR